MLKSSMSKVFKLFHPLTLLIVILVLKIQACLFLFLTKLFISSYEIKWKIKTSLKYTICCPFLHQPRTWCCNSCQILVKLSCSSSLDIKLAATLGVYQTKIYIHTYIHSSVCMWQIKSPEMPRASFLPLTFS